MFPVSGKNSLKLFFGKDEPKILFYPSIKFVLDEQPFPKIT